MTPRVLHHSPRAAGESPSAVTVCVSLYQYRHYIVECLDSVWAQTESPLSLVVVDDASSDGGADEVRMWMEAKGSRFLETSLLRHERNAGLAATRNTAIEHATSEYVFVLDADNAIYPRCLKSLQQALDGKSLAFAYSIIEQFGDVRSIIGCDGWSPAKIAQGNYVDAMALMRRDTWKRVGGYRKMRVSGWEDYDLWCRCVEANLAGVLVPEILCRYRVHGRSMLRRSTDSLVNHLQVSDELRDAHPWIEF
jgi:glycosyltransferase involved in cell wall biosynthesis